MPDTAVSPALIPEPSFDDAFVFVREHAGDARLTSGELLVEHAAGTARIMQTLNVDPAAIAAAALFAIAPHIDDPERVISERFGAEVQSLVADVRKLWRLGSVSSRAAAGNAAGNGPRRPGGEPCSGRSAAQDAARVRAGYSRGADPARIAAAVAALLRGEQARPFAGCPARNTRDLCAAREQVRHLD